jgi:hypothetical protein
MRYLSGRLIAIVVVTVGCLTGVAGAAAPAITDRSEMLQRYERAADAGRFEEALDYATTGCERLQILYLCREVADLPLQMASQGIVPPPRYASEQKRIANTICVPGKRIVNADGADFTGFICEYYAKQFAHAHDPVRQGTFQSRAWQYLDAIHDPDHAGRLYRIACDLHHADACKRLVAQAPVAQQRRP